MSESDEIPSLRVYNCRTYCFLMNSGTSLVNLFRDNSFLVRSIVQRTAFKFVSGRSERTIPSIDDAGMVSDAQERSSLTDGSCAHVIP